MSDEQQPDSLAAQAAAWVPPWERPQRPLDRGYQAAAETEERARLGSGDQEPGDDIDDRADVSVEADGPVAQASDGHDDDQERSEAGLSDDDDDFDEAFEGADPPGYGTGSDEEAALPGAADVPGSVDHPAGEDYREAEPTDVGGGPEVPLPGPIEEAAEQGGADDGVPVDAPLPPGGDDAGDVFDQAADDDVDDDDEIDLPVAELSEDDADEFGAGAGDAELGADDADTGDGVDAEAGAGDGADGTDGAGGLRLEDVGELSAGDDADRFDAGEPGAEDADELGAEEDADEFGVEELRAGGDGAESGVGGDGAQLSDGAQLGARGDGSDGAQLGAGGDGAQPGAGGDAELGAGGEELPGAGGIAAGAAAIGGVGAGDAATGGGGSSVARRGRGAGKGVPEQSRGSRNGGGAVEEVSARTVEDLDDAELTAALEAILLVVDEPVGELQLAQIMEQSAERIARTLDDISARYTAAGHGFDLRRAAGGWRLYTRPEYAAYVERFVLDGQSVRLTQAALETLAVVAYKQPVTRSRISAIRGVNCDGVMRTLVTRGLIEECGTEGETGAYLYRTTTLFLEKLGLNSVDQLPPLAPFLPDDVEEVLDAPG